ncbi:hypothetical protein WG947_09230 [Pontibacter sp. H259]|uniref:hypothetical protein n=1 Tax=Pontibacter sp. H259 TaxID=3133421 RepID=UPI0030C26138
MDKRELRKANGDVFFEAERKVDNSFICANWIGMQSLESIIMAGNNLLSMLRKKPCSGILNNNHELVGPWEIGVEWMAHKWAPQAKELGVKHFAHVMSYGIFGQNSFNTLSPLLKQYFEVRAFEDETAAKDWLQQKFLETKPFKFPPVG